MGAFTLTLAELIDMRNGTLEYIDITAQNITYKHMPKLTNCDIGLDYYPVFDEDYRAVLNAKIIDRFLNREIGSESVEMFQLHMKRKMNEVMPYFNQLYESEKLEYNPISTMDITTKGEVNSEEDTTSTATTNATNDATSKSRAVNSTTPQTQLAGDEDYATSAADSNSTQETLTESEANSNADTSSKTTNDNRVTGYQAVPATLVMRYRESLLNIDVMILNEIEECFMQVFDNADSYFNNSYIL